ncbi:MAG: polysaccharide deacetylase family protein [Thermoplasmata archaeon]|nr:polysaccharide deacetylase family protein [Thermoplasmata archaeon]
MKRIMILFLMLVAIGWGNYYITQIGTLFEDFETVGDWTVAGGTAAAESTIIKTGTKSIKVTTNTAALTNMTKTISQVIPLGRIGLWVNIVDVTKITAVAETGFWIYFSSTTNFSKFYVATVTAANVHNGWNFVSFQRTDFTTTTSESWDNTMVRFRISVSPATDQIATVYYDSLYYGIITKPKVIINFDDGYATVFNIAYPYMENYGFKGTNYIISTLIDSSGKMTLENLTTLYNNGWDISNHTATHPDLTTLTEAEQEAEIQTCNDYLVTNGFVRNSMNKHFATPGGQSDSNTLLALAAQGVKTSREGFGSNVDIYEIPFPYDIPSLSIYNTTSLATAEGYIDTVIASGGMIILLFHTLVETPSVSTQWGIADFEDLMDYLNTKKSQVDVVTMSEWYSGLTKQQLFDRRYGRRGRGDTVWR